VHSRALRPDWTTCRPR